MKKFLLIATMLLFATISFSQPTQGPLKVFWIKDTSAHFTRQYDAGDWIYVITSKVTYVLDVKVTMAQNMNYVLANSNRYHTAPLAAANALYLNSHLYSYFIDTATAQNIYGIKTLYASWFSQSVFPRTTATYSLGDNTYKYLNGYFTNLYVTSANASTASSSVMTSAPTVKAGTSVYINDQIITRANNNRANFNNSLGVGDTIFGPVFSSTGNADIGGGVNTWDAGYFSYSTTQGGDAQTLINQSFYFDDGSNNWRAWGSPQSGTPRNRWDLKSIGHYYIQNKAGTGEVLAIQRDTSGSTAKINLPAVNTIDIAGAITGAAACRATASFSTTVTRKAVAVTGGASTDYYVVSINSADGTTLPVAGDMLSWFAKTDSLIVTRAVGTTSGLSFSYIRLK